VDPATPACLPCLPGMYCPSALPDYPLACPGWSSDINNYAKALSMMISHPEWTGATDYRQCPDVSAAIGRRLIEGGEVSPAAPVNALEVYRQHMWVVQCLCASVHVCDVHSLLLTVGPLPCGQLLHPPAPSTCWQ
jgi:hypothetical protein